MRSAHPEVPGGLPGIHQHREAEVTFGVPEEVPMGFLVHLTKRLQGEGPFRQGPRTYTSKLGGLDCLDRSRYLWRRCQIDYDTVAGTCMDRLVPSPGTWTPPSDGFCTAPRRV